MDAGFFLETEKMAVKVLLPERWRKNRVDIVIDIKQTTGAKKEGTLFNPSLVRWRRAAK